MRILGILNVTRDSFSDGGRYLEPQQALAQARRLIDEGADFIDVGAESTHPDAEDVPADEEIARLTPVIKALRTAGGRISVDTYKPAVIRAVLELGVEIINDVTALRDAEAVAALRDSDARIILMHSTAARARAQRHAVDPATIVARIVAFFQRRLVELEAAGIARRRLILDPGMGFFLGRDPAVSLAVLRNLDRIAALGLPLCISTSRKSFIGALLGSVEEPRPVDQRLAGTLATELWAAQTGVQYLRTHEVRPLHDAAKIWQALAAPRPAVTVRVPKARQAGQRQSDHDHARHWT
ncbi:MAG: dihydropteroate synthase [Phycisphaerae bacterium]|nr:dihydropteroate synthase [Phycisphaerae bacterium]